MGRMNQKSFQIIKEGLETFRYGHWGGAEIIHSLVAHAEAIDHELKVSKEDEEDTARKFGQLAKDNDRLIDNVAQLKRELTEARATSIETVFLPRIVVNALDTCFAAGISGFGIISLSNVTGQLFRDYEPCVIQSLEEIKRFSFHNSGEDCMGPTGGDLIIKAISTSYAVEEPIARDQRLRLDIQELFAKWQGGGRISDLAKDADRLLENHFSEIVN